MNEIKDWILIILTGLGLDIAAMKAGMMGGFMSLTYEKRRNVKQAATSIASGAVLAGYLGPLAAQVFDLKEGAYGAACFIIGLLSMRLVPWIFQAAEQKVKDLAPKLKKKGKSEDGGN